MSGNLRSNTISVLYDQIKNALSGVMGKKYSTFVYLPKGRTSTSKVLFPVRTV